MAGLINGKLINYRKLCKFFEISILYHYSLKSNVTTDDTKYVVYLLLLNNIKFYIPGVKTKSFKIYMLIEILILNEILEW